MNKKMSFSFNRSRDAENAALKATNNWQSCKNTRLTIDGREGGGREGGGGECGLQRHLLLKQSITDSDPLGNPPIRLMIYGVSRPGAGGVGGGGCCPDTRAGRGQTPIGSSFIIITPLNSDPSSSLFSYTLIGIRCR